MTLNQKKNNRVVVVGGGAAGLIAAWRAAACGADVTVIEKNERLGMKILISGGGKCNLTHAGTIDEVLKAFRANEGRFLKPSFYRFSNDDFLQLLQKNGVGSYVRPDGRVFPVERFTARDVVDTLVSIVKKAGANFVIGSPVSAIETESRRVIGVRSGDRFFECEKLILAVGGSSYPATGATGDGYRWASALGHRVLPLRPALAPLNLQEARPEWSGVALRDVVLKARQFPGGKEYARWRGDLLFTHKGVSGPCALGISRDVSERMAAGLAGGGSIEVDLAPDLPFEALQPRLRKQAQASPAKPIAAIMEQFVPERLEGPVWSAAGVDPQVRGAGFASRDLNRLVETLKSWPMGAVRSVPLERGEVVAGGVSLDEVDPKTMRSRIVDGLWLCGEILDIAGPVGGYNLQAAWSTGFVAGESAAEG